MSRGARRNNPSRSEGGTLAPMASAAGDDIAQYAPTIASLVPDFLAWFKLVRQRADNTITAYAFDLRTFCDFCDEAKLRHIDMGDAS